MGLLQAVAVSFSMAANPPAQEAVASVEALTGSLE